MAMAKRLDRRCRRKMKRWAITTQSAATTGLGRVARGTMSIWAVASPPTPPPHTHNMRPSVMEREVEVIRR
jgi:hypothetical protein